MVLTCDEKSISIFLFCSPFLKGDTAKPRGILTPLSQATFPLEMGKPLSDKNPPPQVYTAKRRGPHAKRDKPSFIERRTIFFVNNPQIF